MKERFFNVSILILISAVLTILIEFGFSKISDSFVVSFVISILTIAIFSHILLERTLNYKACFLFTFVLFLVTSILCMLPSSIKENTFLTSPYLHWYLLPLNWFTQMFYCLFRNLMDRGPKFLGFKRYFIKMSLVLGFCFMFYFFYRMFFNVTPSTQTIDTSYNFIPFLTMATYIESYIYNSNMASSVAAFFVPAILLYLPFGFYLRLFGKNLTTITRTLILASIPFTVELLQLFLHVGVFDVDDILLALIGGSLGVLLYHIINTLYLSIKGDDFLYERSGYYFSRRF